MFKQPDFSKKELEIRYENDVVCIYGSPSGLRKLSRLCEELIEDPNQGHIHLEDLDILTSTSLKGVIAIFKNENGKA